MAALISVLASVLALAAHPSSAATEAQEGLISEFRAAVEARRDVAASDILCQITVYGVECGRDDPYRDYFRDARALWHRRYSEVFLPPTNADSLARRSWQEAMPWSGGTYGGVAYISAEENGIPTTRYVPWDGSSEDLAGKMKAVDTPSYMIVRNTERPFLLVDLDLDGRPDLTFDGSALSAAEGIAVASDDAGDGRRYQWMVGGEGSDPRQQARMWIYRDSCFYNLFFDTDGDGRGNCGAGGRIP